MDITATENSRTGDNVSVNFTNAAGDDLFGTKDSDGVWQGGAQNINAKEWDADNKAIIVRFHDLYVKINARPVVTTVESSVDPISMETAAITTKREAMASI